MREISKERVERFWKWCGFEPTRLQSGTWGWLYPPEYVVELGVLPLIDLNNLFKYAVPKVKAMGYEVILCCDVVYSEVEIVDRHFPPKLPYSIEAHEDPATALLLAVDNLIAEGQ